MSSFFSVHWLSCQTAKHRFPYWNIGPPPLISFMARLFHHAQAGQ